MSDQILCWERSNGEDVEYFAPHSMNINFVDGIQLAMHFKDTWKMQSEAIIVVIGTSFV